MEIKEIKKEDTWEIRHIAMWPSKDIDYIKLEGDDKGAHYGLYQGKKLVSVISLFIEGDRAQFRKFATLEEEQGKGYGTKLLNYTIEQAKALGVKSLWCNARKDKANFYKRFGLLETDQVFEKGNIEFVIMEKRL